MPNWNPTNYLTYGNERTRAAKDLALRINLESPAQIADLGCGPGNSTQILYHRWPEAGITAIDNSSEMIESARREYPAQEFVLADIATWSPGKTFDLVYSNAALHWIPDHKKLVKKLFGYVSADGAFAFQIPSSTFPAVRTHIHEISHDPKWNTRMKSPSRALTMEKPSFYYDALVYESRLLDIWETEYFHVLDSHESIIDWISGTGLRPFLEALDTEREREHFLDLLRERVHSSYESQSDGKILFPFRRTFVIAYR
jgi:trans-aconitate 2-methyltransferase